jgi:hypothetical protein
MIRSDFLKCIYLLFIGFLFSLFYLNSVHAVEQDDLCEKLNITSISECNDYYDFFTNQTILTQVTNNTIQSDFDDTNILNRLDDLEEEIEYLKDNSNDMTDFQKYQIDLDHEYRMNRLKSNQTIESDPMSQIEKAVSIGVSTQLMQKTVCKSFPDLDFCTIEEKKVVNNPNNDTQILDQILPITDSHNVRLQTLENKDNKLYLFLSVIGLICGVYSVFMVHAKGQNVSDKLNNTAHDIKLAIKNQQENRKETKHSKESLK